MKKFRRLAFEGVADELKDPAHKKYCEGVQPQPVNEDAGDKKRERQKNDGNAEGVTEAVDGMAMAGTVLRDPLLVGASAQHAEDDTTKEKRLAELSCQPFS
ncbi:MAG: hypothetical protein WAK29_15015 [Terriglobales bacterium]